MSGGQERVQEFIMEQAGDMLEMEVKAATPGFQLPLNSDLLSHNNLICVNFREFGVQLQLKGTLLLWRLLQRLTWMRQQREKNTVKNPFHVWMLLNLRNCAADLLTLYGI